MKKLLLALIFLALPSISFANTPTLFCTDLTDGPNAGWENGTSKGAAVSIWGYNLGSAVSGSYLTIGGVQINSTDTTNIAEWGATTTPTTARGEQRITFWLPSNTPTGSQTITVTTADGISNSLPFYVRALGSSHIYYLDWNNGNDSNSGLTTSTAWKNPSKLRATLQAGDVAYCRSGTYTSEDNDSAWEGHTRGGNMSFGYNGSTHNFHNGSANNSIAVVSYPGEAATWQAHDDAPNGPLIHNIAYASYHSGTMTVSYWTFSKLTLSATYSDVQFEWNVGQATNHWRIVGCDLSTIQSSDTTEAWGTQLNFDGTSGGCQYLYVLANYIHDTRDNISTLRMYQTYIGGYGWLDYIYFGYNEYTRNHGGRLFQIYGHTITDTLDHFYLFDNFFHDGGMHLAVVGGGDPGNQGFYQFVQHAYIYNNIFANPADGYQCLQVGSVNAYGDGGVYRIYNNVFYQPHAGQQALIWYAGVNPSSSSVLDVLWENNLFVSPGNTYGYITYAAGYNNGTNTGNHNLYYGYTAGQKPSWETGVGSIYDGTAPGFATTPSIPCAWTDFKLASNSPAIGAASTNVGGLFTDDSLGYVRGSSWDIGAFEYAASTGGNTDYAPSMSISSPTSSSTYSTSDDHINLGGTASDDHGISTITWANNTGGGTANNDSGNWTSWSIANIALQEGVNTITVTAQDSSGQKSSSSITVSYTLASGILTKTFSDRPNSDYTGTVQDTFINVNTDTNGNSTILNTYTWPVNKVANAIILKWDLSQIPSSATIQSAQLVMYLAESGGDSTYSLSAHRIINHNPILNSCNGYTYDGSHGWTANSQCYNNIPMAQADIAAATATMDIDTTSGDKTWDITQMVQNWVTNSGSNFGILINPGTSAAAASYRAFSSTESANSSQRPKLVITYSVSSGANKPVAPTWGTTPVTVIP